MCARLVLSPAHTTRDLECATLTEERLERLMSLLLLLSGGGFVSAVCTKETQKMQLESGYISTRTVCTRRGFLKVKGFLLNKNPCFGLARSLSIARFFSAPRCTR